MEEEKQGENTLSTPVSSLNHELLLLLQQTGHFLYHKRSCRSGQRRILLLLERWEKEHGSEEGMSQQELQRQLGIKSGSISEILGKMEANGLLRKARLSTDRRKICIFLTQAGRDRLESKRAENRKQEEVMFQRLSADEQEELKRLLDKMLSGWEEDFDFCIPGRRKADGNTAPDPAAEVKMIPGEGKEPPCGNI